MEEMGNGGGRRGQILDDGGRRGREGERGRMRWTWSEVCLASGETLEATAGVCLILRSHWRVDNTPRHTLRASAQEI